MELPVEALHEARCPYSSSSMALQYLSTALLLAGKYRVNAVEIANAFPDVRKGLRVNVVEADVVGS